MKKLVSAVALVLLIFLATPVTSYAACGGLGQPTCPAAPTLTGNAQPNQDNLSWNAISAATSYSLKRGTTIIYVGGVTEFHDTGLTNGNTYAYTVTAIDSSGNSSAASNTVSLTPQAQSSNYPITAFQDGSQITWRDINLMAIYATGIIVLILVHSFRWRGND